MNQVTGVTFGRLGMRFVLASLCVLAVCEGGLAGNVHSLDGDQWQMAVDQQDIGRANHWYRSPHDDARQAQVPWIIQDAFPGYHGVAWYWRNFKAPSLHDGEQRCLLRFWAVDYLADVWLNGVYVGGHEGGETPFVLDVTDVINAEQENLLAVRVLNPTHERIDGMVLAETPRQARVIPYHAGAAYNHGGITGNVELLVTPLVRVEDLYARADPQTGIIRISANMRNASDAELSCRLSFRVAPAASGETLNVVELDRKLAAGDTLVETEIRIEQPHLWELNDPFLYRVTLQAGDDECSVRCGFREFCFQNGYFRLNGRRIYLRSTHTCNHFPVGLKLPPDPDMARRDLLDLKVMGFNMIRFIWGGAERYQLDLCDEIGLMVYEESFASSAIQESPQLAERWERSIGELIQRDRNHPSVVIWGLLNEVRDSPHFRLAANSLPMVRKLDDSRMVFLNSGRWDLAGINDPVFTKLDIWHNQAGREPWATLNPSADPVETPFNFTWPPRQVALHPGPQGEYSVVRWTAPANDRYSVDATFTGLYQTTTDVHVLQNGKPHFVGQLNIGGQPNQLEHTSQIMLAVGDTLDFVVGWGNGSYGSDSTALTVTIRSASGTVFDLASDFPRDQNPTGPWTCGWLPANSEPDSAKFNIYTESRSVAKSRHGSLANPGSVEWEDLLADRHYYPRVPQTAASTRDLRQMTGEGIPLFLSEYGIGSCVDLWRTTRHFERLGKIEVEDAQFYRDKLDRFLQDWNRWQLQEIFARPDDFFSESQRKMAGQRTLGLDAIRSNPHIVGYSLTGMNDHVSCGEGLTTTFRELKRGTVDAMFEGLAPLRLCLSVEPIHMYRGATAHFRAILANEDALPPGEYPVQLLVVGPRNQRICERLVHVTIEPEMPFALPVWEEDIVLDVPSGAYRFLASIQHGGAATGGEVECFVTDAAEMPIVRSDVTLVGDDALVTQWLTDQGIHCHSLDDNVGVPGELILVSGKPQQFDRLWRHVQHGATAIVLAPECLQDTNRSLVRLPLPTKGVAEPIRGWLYLKDEWAKRHPAFDGLPAGGLMDYAFYREIIPDTVLVGLDPPAEAVAGAIKASQDYASGLMLAVYDYGAGRIILNSLLIRDNLGRHPAAERLLRNLLNYAAAK